MRYDIIKIKQKLDADTYKKNCEELKALKSKMTLEQDYLTPQDADILIENLNNIAKEFTQDPGRFLNIEAREVDDIKEFVAVLKGHQKFAQDLKETLIQLKSLKHSVYDLDDKQFQRLIGFAKEPQIQSLSIFKKYLIDQHREVDNWVNFSEYSRNVPTGKTPLTQVLWKFGRFSWDVRKSTNLSQENYDRIKLLGEKVQAYEIKNLNPDFSSKAKPPPLKRRNPKP